MMVKNNKGQPEIVEIAKRVFEIEAKAIFDLTERVNADFCRVVDLLFGLKGKVVTTGIGKSGIIARKIASTLTSTGTKSLFLHPSESAHGDMGIMDAADALLVVSYRGEGSELNPLLSFASRKGLPVVALTGQPESTLAKWSQFVLDVSVKREACPLNLAPTASTTASLAMGDALAMALLVKRGFNAEDFAEYHPGGALGRKLLKVSEVMHSGEGMPIVNLDTSMREVLSVMTAREVRGTAGVVNPDGELVGVITDGDIRRRLEKSENPTEGLAQDIMSLTPKTIDQEELVEKALFMMEEFRIQTLFVVDAKTTRVPLKPLGIIHLQDLLRLKVR